MDNLSRDLLVLLKGDFTNSSSLDLHLQGLYSVLYKAETMENFTITHEIFDVNKGKIISKPFRIYNYIRKNKTGPFVFLFNKN